MSTQAATENGQKSKYRTVKKKSQWKTIWIRFKRNKLAVAGLVVFLIMAVIVLSADLWLDYESGATTMDLANAYCSRPFRRTGGRRRFHAGAGVGHGH